MSTITTRQWLDHIRALELPRRFKVMNVCGGHERSIATIGLRKALPANIELVPGPGCPVCVCPEESVYQAIQLALVEKVILVAFGDMLRVPVNVRKNEARSLEQARAAGGEIVPIASPQEAVRIARENPQRRVVFFAAGFETTTAPVAAMLAEGVPDNLSVLLAGRRTWPAVAMLLEFGRAWVRRACRPRSRLDCNGSGGMGVCSAKTRHPGGRRRLYGREPRRRALFGAAPNNRRALLSRQLLSRGGAPGGQSGCAALYQRHHGGCRCQLAWHRRYSGIRLCVAA